MAVMQLHAIALWSADLIRSDPINRIRVRVSETAQCEREG